MKFKFTVLAITVMAFFNAKAQVPTIESFSPESGGIGTTVTITGTNFDAIAANNIVYFGTSKATVVSGTTTELTVEVPVGATYKPISVLSNGLIACSTKPFAVTFESNGAISSSSTSTFADVQYFTVDNFTNYIDFGDIDLDGKVDMLVASEGEYLVYRNTSSAIGDISFATKVSIPVGSDYVNDMKIADFDGDGKIDIATVTANYAETNYHINVDRNTSTGAGTVSFTNDVFSVFKSTSYSIDVGDINMDGKVDIVAVDEVNNQISVFENTSTLGAISFAAPTNFTVGAEPWTVKLADINNDNLLDIITVNYADTSISVLKNTSSFNSISFDTKVDFATNVDDNAESLTIGDLNDDGLPDIIVKSVKSLSVFQNNSTTSIAMNSPITINMEVGYGLVNLDNFNGDGKPDILVNPDDIVNGVFQNTSSGGNISIEGVQKYDVHAFLALYSTSSDLDGDGEPEIISASTNSIYTENYINIFRNKHSAAQIEEFSFAEQTGATVIDNENKTIEIEVSGLPDLTNLAPTFTLSPLAQADIADIAQESGVTANDFSNPVTYTISAEDDTTVVDWTVTVTLTCAVEYDTLDVETCGSYDFNGQELTYSGTYSGIFTNRFGCDSIVTLNLTVNPTHFYNNVSAIGSYDFNGTTLTSSGQYTAGPYTGSTGCDSTYVLNLSITPEIYEPQTYLRFNKSEQEFTGIVGGIFTGDIDGDNDDDFLICGNKSYADNNYVSFIYENDGDGNFTENTSPFGNISSTSKSSKLLDIDGDGDLDFLLFGHQKTGITIEPISVLFLNDGSGNFTAKSDANLPVVENAAIDTADVDGDGDIDFMINGRNGGEIAELWLNDGNEVFSKDESNSFITSFNGSVNFLDVDNDGDQDVFVTGDSEASQNAKLYINDGDGNFTLRENLPFLGVTTSIVTVFDVDGDNDQDIFVTGQSHDAENNDFAIIYVNDGNGYFNADTTSLIPEFKNGDAKSADLDNDGDIDLIISGDMDVHTLDEGDTTLVFLNNGFGHFTSSVQCSLTNFEYSFISVNDWDKDGRKNFLITGYSENSIKTELYLNEEFSNNIVIEACDSFEFDGNTLTESGTYQGHYGDGVGCDYPVNLTLTINNSTVGDTTATACVSFEWYGTVYTESATPTHTFTSSTGCDSVVTLNLTILEPTSSTDIIRACDSYTWIDGVTYTESNSAATYTLTNAAGCDSIVTLNLTINNSTVGDTTATACVSFEWYGTVYTESATPTHTFTSSTGCDSVVTLNLTILEPTSSTDIITACDSYTWIDGVIYTESNSTATYTLTNAAGCDSIVTLNLTINNSTVGDTTATACGSFEWYGTVYTESATPTHTFTSSTGCDSIVTLNLTILEPTSSTDIITACDSYTWIDGVTYTESNSTATYTLTNAAGCDSIVTLNLTINNSTVGDTTASVCGSFEWYGTVYTESATPTHTFISSTGCDSVVTLDLTINYPSAIDTSILTCSEFEYNGTIYDSSGIYSTTLVSHTGCDSIVNINLTILEETFSYDTIKACSEYVWHGETYNLSGDYEKIFTNSVGCDSVAMLNLTISTSDTCITSSVSNLIKEEIKVFPNPANDFLNIEIASEGYNTISIIDMMGRVILSETSVERSKQINVSELNKGTYILKFKGSKGVNSNEMLFIKQ